jgi:hypothetical protein
MNMQTSQHEQELRQKFGLTASPTDTPVDRFKHLGAFWPMWNLHQRKCGHSGKAIVSVFRPDCPYPVWHRDAWFAEADPPQAEFDPGRPFFEQAWELFQSCPIPHAFQSHNQNCEYTDDWYYSKNCYLCHSGQNNEDCRYCYGCDSITDLQGAVFSFNSEVCADLINCSKCFGSFYLLNCKNVHDCGFLYDCRDCSDCLFCSNLRNKKYCFGNEQLSREEFEAKKAEWDFGSQKVWEHAKDYFADMMQGMAWHRAQQIDHSENSSGNYVHHSKDCENCYMLSYHENCANVCFSGPQAKTALDCLGTVGAELTYMCSLPVYCYEARRCFSVSHCRFVEYSAYMQNCQYCFGCCGLVNRKFCVFNKQYEEAEYHELVARIKAHMQQPADGKSGLCEWDRFFPGYFAPNPYAESYSGFHFPLTGGAGGEITKQGYRDAEPLEKADVKTAEVSKIPDSLAELTPEKEAWLMAQVFWDEEYARPFQIQAADITFARRLEIALPRVYYVNRMQGNFRWMPLIGQLRDGVCAKSGVALRTNWPAEYDGRILCEEEYLKIVK